MTELRLAVVVLNWNNTADTKRCLQSLLPELSDRDRVLVVDNASEAGELDALRGLDAFGNPRVERIENDRNLGFAGGTNTGVRRALELEARWVLWWNNDALPDPGAIEVLLEAAERLELDSAGVLLRSERDPSRIDSIGLGARRSFGGFDLRQGESIGEAPTEPQEILGPCGAAALFRVETLRKAGLCDDRLFVLCEDLDQSLRIAKVGGRSMVVPAATATHRRGVSDRPETAKGRRLRKLWLQRNTVGLALRDWPTSMLLLSAPALAFRMAQALWLSRGTEFACRDLWKRALGARSESRSAMRTHSVDRWLS